MAAPTKFHFSSHAIQRGKDRDISPALAIEVVSFPDSRKKQHRGTHGGIVYLFMKTFDGSTLNVAAELFKDECFFVTGYWT
jgi:hypothetical protein